MYMLDNKGKLVRVGVWPIGGYNIHTLEGYVGSDSIRSVLVPNIDLFHYPTDFLGREYICEDDIDVELDIGIEILYKTNVYIITNIEDTVIIANHQGTIFFDVTQDEVVLARRIS